MKIDNSQLHKAINLGAKSGKGEIKVVKNLSKLDYIGQNMSELIKVGQNWSKPIRIVRKLSKFADIISEYQKWQKLV